MVANFMGTGNGVVATNNGSASSVGVEDDLSGLAGGRRGGGRNNNRRDAPAQSGGFMKYPRQLLKGLLGGLGGGRGGNGGTASTVAAETNVAATAGEGASSGLPTCADDGSIEMVFHQVTPPRSNVVVFSFSPD